MIPRVQPMLATLVKDPSSSQDGSMKKNTMASVSSRIRKEAM